MQTTSPIIDTPEAPIYAAASRFLDRSCPVFLHPDEKAKIVRRLVRQAKRFNFVPR